MAINKKIVRDQQFVQQLHGFVETNQEIAILRMQKVRQSVLEARQYMDGILSVFRDVRQSHQEEIQRILEKKSNKRDLDISNGKKELYILLSPSGRFTGPLIQKIFNEFAKVVQKPNSEVMIIGGKGKNLAIQAWGEKQRFTYFPADLDTLKESELKQLVEKITSYDNITVYTGKFFTLLDQQSHAYNISGYELLQSQTQQPTNQQKYLFEPDVFKMVNFFTTQITQSLFQKTVNEAHLAYLGSRIVTLESSLDGIMQSLNTLSLQLKSTNRRLKNRKQAARMSGMNIWN